MSATWDLPPDLLQRLRRHDEVRLRGGPAGQRHLHPRQPVAVGRHHPHPVLPQLPEHPDAFKDTLKAEIEEGLRLTGAWITATAHCAPPGNKPAPREIRNCRIWLHTELDLQSVLAALERRVR